MAERSTLKVVGALFFGAVLLVVVFVVIVAACDPNARACPPGKRLVIVSTGKVVVINCV